MSRNLTDRPRPALPEAARRIAQPLHPSYEDLARHLHAKQGSAQWTMVAQHLAICARCAGEVQDLQALDAQLDYAEPAKPLGFLDWLRQLVAFPQASPAFAGASAFAMLLGVLAIWPQAAIPPDAGSVNAVQDILRPTDFAVARLAAGWTLAAGGACGLLFNIFSRKK